MRGCIARTGLKRQKFPVFSRETGNTEAETGSPMTASTAISGITSLENTMQCFGSAFIQTFQPTTARFLAVPASKKSEDGG
jgi:hypothetical protein